MENLTQTQVENATLIFFNSIDEMLKGFDNTAKVAKAISLAIGIEFSDACKLLVKLTDLYLEFQHELFK